MLHLGNKHYVAIRGLLQRVLVRRQGPALGIAEVLETIKQIINKTHSYTQNTDIRGLKYKRPDDKYIYLAFLDVSLGSLITRF